MLGGRDEWVYRESWMGCEALLWRALLCFAIPSFALDARGLRPVRCASARIPTDTLAGAFLDVLPAGLPGGFDAGA